MKPPFTRQAFVHMYEESVICSPVIRTLDGWGVGTAAVFVCGRLSPVDVGRCLLSALENSIDNVPDDSINPKDGLNAIVKVAGAKSWRAFHAKAKMVVAYQKPGSRKVKLTPTRAEGGSGSAHLDEKERHSSILLSELGSSVLAALEDSE